MASQFLQITFTFADGNPKTKELAPIFDKGIDWYRFNAESWVVWTNSSAETWYKRLRPHISDADSIFIVAINRTESQGWMSKSFWDWLNKDRTKK